MEPTTICKHGGLRRKCDTCDTEDEVRRLTSALECIRDFGRVHTGRGFSCSRMAAEALTGWDPAQTSAACILNYRPQPQ